MPELLYITHGDVLHAQYLSAGPTFVLLVGSAYGLIRMAKDVLLWLNRHAETSPPSSTGQPPESQ